MNCDFFIITGFPRSRTAWLANFFTYGSSFCLHDASAWGDPNDLMEKLAKDYPKLRHVGDSDSGLLGYRPACPDFYLRPNVRLVIIKREKEEALQSYLNFFESHPCPALVNSRKDIIPALFDHAEREMLNLIREVPGAHVVAYESLERPETLRHLWKVIVPDEPYMEARGSLLDDLRINVASEKIGIL